MQEGWLFRAPSPWLAFGRRPAYLVTDAQKATLAARIRASRYIRLLLGIPLVVAVPLWIDLVRNFSPLGNTTLVLGLYLVAVHFIEYLMTRGLLADLPRATGRMSVTDMVRQQSAAMSVRSQAVLCVFFALATCLATGCLLLAVPAEQDLLRYVARLSGFFFTIWLGMLVAALWRRWRPSTAVSSDHDRSGRRP